MSNGGGGLTTGDAARWRHLVLLAQHPDWALSDIWPDEVVPAAAVSHCFWFDLPVEDVAGYLLLRAFARERQLQNPAVQLAGLHIFPLEMPLDRLEVLSEKVVAVIRANLKVWRLVEKRAEDFITPTRSERLAALLPVDACSKVIGALVSPTMLFLYLRQRLLVFFAKPAESSLAWTAELGHRFRRTPNP